MEYSLPEATRGVKWECVWNVIITFNFITFFMQVSTDFKYYLRQDL